MTPFLRQLAVLTLCGASTFALADDAKPKVKPYGIIVVNAVNNTGTPEPSQDAPIGAVPGSGIGDELETDGSFVVTPRQSRVGLDATVPIHENTTADAKVEVDFFGIQEHDGPGATTQTTFRLRHAYATFGSERARVLVGQGWSVVTPRLPTSYSHMAIALHSFTGAVWNRLPQITGDVRAPLGESATFRFQAGVARAHTSHGDKTMSRFDEPDPGTRGQLPIGQARLSLETTPVIVGVSGHLGRETYDLITGMDQRPGVHYGETLYEEVHVPTWMVSADLRVEIGNILWTNMQGYRGKNLNGLFSRQGVRLDPWGRQAFEAVPVNDPRHGATKQVEGLPATGGWAELGVRVMEDPNLRLVASTGIDRGDPKRVDFGDAWLATGYFGGVLLEPWTRVDLSVEFYRSDTHYIADTSARLDEDYDKDTDPLRGESPPLSERRGINDSLSLNIRLRF